MKRGRRAGRPAHGSQRPLLSHCNKSRGITNQWSRPFVIIRRMARGQSGRRRRRRVAVVVVVRRRRPNKSRHHGRAPKASERKREEDQVVRWRKCARRTAAQAPPSIAPPPPPPLIRSFIRSAAGLLSFAHQIATSACCPPLLAPSVRGRASLSARAGPRSATTGTTKTTTMSWRRKFFGPAAHTCARAASPAPVAPMKPNG